MYLVSDILAVKNVGKDLYTLMENRPNMPDL